MTAFSRQLADAMPTAGATVSAGLVTQVDSSGVVTVNVGGREINATVLLGYPVALGDDVIVARQGGLTWILAPAVANALPTTGTVSSVPVSSSVILVSTAIGTLGLPFLASYASPTAGDAVYILWAGTQGYVVGKQGAIGTPPAAPPVATPARPPAPPSPPSSGIRTFVPIQTGSYSGGWNTALGSNDDVAQGTPPGGGAQLGAWFYGGAILPTLSGATVTRCQLWLSRTFAGSASALTANVYQTTNDVRPVGAPTYTGSSSGQSISPGQSAWFDLPTSLGQALVNSGGGLGIQTGSYLRIAGKSADPASGSVRITYTK